MFRRFVHLAIALAAVGCAGSVATDDAGSGSGGSGGGGSGGTSGGVTYTQNIKPLFAAKCAPCHTTQGLGAHNLGTTYADVHKLVMSIDAPPGCFKDGFDRMMPKTMGECALAAIMDGWMPMAMGCFNTPRPAPCVSVAEEATVAAWVAAGMPE
jgi:hypothetical protein